MEDWWRDPETQMCLFHVPVGGGASHVLTLHGRQVDGQVWQYAIVQWWHKSPTLWLWWESDAVLQSSPDLMAQIREPAS